MALGAGLGPNRNPLLGNPIFRSDVVGIDFTLYYA